MAVLAVAALAPGGLAAADEGWTIERFDAQIVVRADGTLRVAEAIDVDFGGQQKHGVFRRIPVRYRYAAGRDRVYDLRVVSVADAAGRAWRYERTSEGADVVLRIGDPDRTVSGKQTYRVAYDVAGVLNGFPDHDELFWNVNGTWPVLTRSLAAHVRLEPGSQVTRVACFQGRSGSTESCAATMRGSSGDMAATRALPEDQQVTVVVAFPKGTVPEPRPILEARPRDIDAWWELDPLTLGGAGLVLLAGLGLLGRRYGTAGRDPTGPTTIVPEYEPPERLRPAEVGLLIDESADTKDLTATIVHLAVRGYLRIEEQPGHGIFGGRDWTLVRVRPADDGLAPYERRLFDGLFAGRDQVKLSDLRGTFHSTLAAAQRDLYRASVGSGWFPTDPSAVRTVTAGLGGAIAVAGAGVAAALGILYGAGIVGVALAVVGVATMLAAGAMPRRTTAGRGLLWHVRGFRRYIETAETERQRFAERENIFAEYLPYAIVFGLVSRWAAAFSQLDAQRATQGWYAGSFTSIPSFSSDLSSFSSGLGTAISSTPGSSGSSGFGGGGSAGGGGGGGGGGSW